MDENDFFGICNSLVADNENILNRRKCIDFILSAHSKVIEWLDTKQIPINDHLYFIINAYNQYVND